jgi:hypothetical protein
MKKGVFVSTLLTSQQFSEGTSVTLVDLMILLFVRRALMIAVEMTF